MAITPIIIIIIIISPVHVKIHTVVTCQLFPQHHLDETRKWQYHSWGVSSIKWVTYRGIGPSKNSRFLFRAAV